MSLLFSMLSATAAAAKSLQMCPTRCNPIDSSPPGSSVPGILQARTPEWAAISCSNACMHVKALQSCLTLCDPMDRSPPSYSVHGTLQGRILGWVAISFFKYAVSVIHNFPSKEQASFKFMAIVKICSDFAAPQNKVSHCFHCFPIYLP